MKRRIKVCIILDVLIPGGVQKAAIEEARNLKKLGFEPTLLILSKEGFKENDYLAKDIDFRFLQKKGFKLPIFRFLSTSHLLSPILVLFGVKNYQYDLSISHGTTASLTALSLKLFKNIPYIAIIHDPAIYILDKIYSQTILKFIFPVVQPIVSFLEKHFINQASICLVDSKVHKNLIQKNYHIKPVVLYLGISLNEQSSSMNNSLGDQILTFGRWDKGKGLGILLELLRELPGTQLIVAGSWSKKDELSWFKNLVWKQDLGKRVEIIPSFDKNSIRKIASRARFWIHPHFEAFSLSALEAASMGLPIMIPQKSGVTELFKHGIHGFFTKGASLGEFKKYATILLKDKKLASEMGRNASRQVCASYTHMARAEKLAGMIRQCLQRKTKLVALETANIGNEGISGGDSLLVEMMKRINLVFDLTVTQHSSSNNHWEKSGLRVELIKISANLFDKYLNPLAIFASYLIRIFQTILTTYKIPSPFVLYSSSEILPDAISSFFVKIFKGDIFWIARIHHIWLSPFKRPGNFLNNAGSYILDKISLEAIKTKADLIIVLNNSLKDYLKKHGFNEKNIQVLGGGVDYQAIYSFKPKKVTGYAGVYLGRLHPIKGIFDLPLIWREVVRLRPGSKLAIIGPGSKKIQKEFFQSIKKFGLEDNISILGFLPQKKVLSILKNSKTFLFTDHEAGFGLAVAEAMATGLPVVGWDIGLLGKVYKKGYIKVPLNNLLAFAHSIVKILKEPGVHKMLSANAMEEAHKFDWNRVSKKFGKIITDSIKLPPFPTSS